VYSCSAKAFLHSPRLNPSLTTSITSSGEGRLNADSTAYKHVQINNSALAISQTLGLGEADSLTLSLAYDQTSVNEGNYHHFERDYSADKVPLPNELQSLGIALEHSKKVGKDWTFYSSIGAASHVDKHDLLSKGWGTNWHLAALYTYNPNLALTFGLAYDSLSHDWKLIPLLGLEWKPADKWSVAIGFPKTAVSYELLPRLKLSLAASGDGGTYYLKDDPRPGTAPRSLADSKLEYTEARLGFQADWKINRTSSLSGAIGQVLYRNFKYIDRNYQLKARDVVPFVSLATNSAF